MFSKRILFFKCTQIFWLRHNTIKIVYTIFIHQIIEIWTKTIFKDKVLTFKFLVTKQHTLLTTLMIATSYCDFTFAITSVRINFFKVYLLNLYILKIQKNEGGTFIDRMITTSLKVKCKQHSKTYACVGTISDYKALNV